MTEKKGKKRGAPLGRRPKVWVCSAVKDNKLISEVYLVKDQEPESSAGIFPKEVAEAEFLQTFGIESEITQGPFNKLGNQANKVKKKRLYINRDDIDKYRIGLKRRNAIFGDWKGYSNELEGNDDLRLFFFMSEANPSGKKRTIPTPGIVKVTDITFLDDEQPQQQPAS